MVHPALGAEQIADLNCEGFSRPHNVCCTTCAAGDVGWLSSHSESANQAKRDKEL